jgi:starch phosphorylase
VNLSTRDGWWAEAYREEVGWALDGDDDNTDAAHLYDLLEHEVIPSFYERDAQGIPHPWINRMRASMASLTPVYSANRALREYTERYYLPAARAFARRTSDAANSAVAIAGWERTMRDRWSSLRFGDVRVRTATGHHRFEATAYLDGVDPASVSVELFADGTNGSDPVRVEMRRETPLVGAHGFVFIAEVPDTRPSWHFTPRLVPVHPAVAVPLEMPLITWAQ